MDARRGQVYGGIYMSDHGEMKEQIPCECIEMEKLIEKINVRNQEVIFLGDGVPVNQKLIEEKVTVPFRFAQVNLSRQRASSVAMAAINKYNKGIYTTGTELTMEYLRISQAERERLEREERNKSE